jgi:hypothetical protein
MDGEPCIDFSTGGLPSYYCFGHLLPFNFLPFAPVRHFHHPRDGRSQASAMNGSQVTEMVIFCVVVCSWAGYLLFYFLRSWLPGHAYLRGKQHMIVDLWSTAMQTRAVWAKVLFPMHGIHCSLLSKHFRLVP